MKLHHLYLIARFQNLGEMMTLGRNDAALSPSFIEGLTLEGPVGHAGNNLFQCCGTSLVSVFILIYSHKFPIVAARKIAYLIRLPTDEHRLKVGISWLTKSAVDSVASIQSTLSKVLSGS